MRMDDYVMQDIEEDHMHDSEIHSDEETDLEELEIALYSQIHYACEDASHLQSHAAVYSGTKMSVLHNSCSDVDTKITPQTTISTQAGLGIQAESSHVLKKTDQDSSSESVIILEDDSHFALPMLMRDLSNKAIDEVKNKSPAGRDEKNEYIIIESDSDCIIDQECTSNKTKTSTALLKRKIHEEVIVVSSMDSDLFLEKQHRKSKTNPQWSTSSKSKKIKLSKPLLESGSEEENDMPLLEGTEGDCDIQTNVVQSKPKVVLDCAELDIEDLDLEEVHNSLDKNANWDIIDEDRFKLGTKNRYYQPLNVKCHNCNERGHLSKCCPKPKKAVVCIYCGNQGHTSKSCPDSLCYNCNQSGHSVRECFEPRRRLYEECWRCHMQGHKGYECTDRWRQYHMTTKEGPLCETDNSQNERMYCYNCASEGHFGFECEDATMDKRKLPNLPFVARYDTEQERSKARRKRDSTENEQLSKKQKEMGNRKNDYHKNKNKKEFQDTAFKKKKDGKRRKTSKNERNFLQDPDEYFPRSEAQKYKEPKKGGKRKNCNEDYAVPPDNEWWIHSYRGAKKSRNEVNELKEKKKSKNSQRRQRYRENKRQQKNKLREESNYKQTKKVTFSQARRGFRYKN
ncbi:zinc finger CCHC domain-containing protein 7 [Lingula anatina]|uniref:Zinc finger CCHC domain-containing protein 7 n=1 Tax=Lingula anatina TaxID=7574 RepID=A0A1S3JL37_LINAN|nr:zinc finger CCHC domain-containing protein 7 [Lingula anatina]|eukprot:XP_013411082.1 zinc finger CCHC domain-containing protein 7 [Lingula anatina]